MQWQDIDFEKNRLHVRRSIAENGEGKLVEVKPKSKKSMRTISVPLDIAEFLEEKFSLLTSDNLGGRYVFPDANGGPLRGGNVVRRSFKPLIEKAGVTNIRFHDMRHTCATMLLQEKVSPNVVKEMLGHAKVSTTLEIYGHVTPMMSDEVAEVLTGLVKSA